MEYTIPVKQENYYKAKLTAINCFLKLTTLEIGIVTSMLNKEHTKITKECRRDIMKELDIDYFTLSNYLRRLKGKDVMIVRGKSITLNPNLITNLQDKTLTIKFHVI